MSDYSIAIKIAGQLEGSFAAALKGAQSGLSGLGVSGKVGTVALKGVGLAAKATAATLAAAGSAIVAVGAYSVSVGKQFESQMSTVQSIVGTVADSDLPALQQAARDMGLSFQEGANATETAMNILSAKAKQMGSTTSFSATEAGQAMEYMAMAGWKTSDMLAGIGGIMNLAAATGEDLASTSDIVTDALTAFGLSASSTQAFVDDLAQAARSSNTDVSMMGESFKQVATAAGGLGYSTKDVAVALGAMANSGIKGEKSGTMLAKMFTRMSGTNSNATKAMNELGLTMFNTDGSARELSAVLADMRTAFSGLSDAEKENYAYMIGGQSAMNGLLAIVNSSEDDWNNLTAAIENSTGAAEEMAAIKLDNLEGDITLLKSAAEGFGISIYESMNAPLREVVQYGQEQLGILQDALNQGGFEGLASAIGDVAANGLAKLAENAPEFIDMAATLVESFIDGIDNNSEAIGSSAARLGTALLSALIRLVPRMITIGGKLMVEFAKGIVQNLPQLKAAGAEAVEYLMTAAKDALKNYVNFLGDDEVAPFEKILGLLPAVAAGFAGFAVVDGIAGGIKGLITSFKGVSKTAGGVTKGMGGVGKSMSSLAKNILGVGAGLALAAAGIMLLVASAKAISEAGPGAVAALLLMVGGLVALMAVASSMGPKLQSSQQGLIAFGAAILMAAAGMAIMSYAAVQIAQAGPMAFAALALMEGGIIALMAIAGSMGTQLATAAPGLIAFGAAILIAAAGMALMSYAAIQLAAAGGPAIAVFAGMAVAVAAFMAVAALLGPMLISGGAGMLLLGAGLLLAAAGMMLLVNAAISLSSAGAPAIITMAALAVGILAFGAAAGALAPLLLAGAAALAALGAALVVVSTAALLGSAALLIISAALPSLAEYGASGALAIVELGAAMTVFAGGAALAGAGAGAAALGFGALALAAAAADLAFAPLAVEMLAVSGAIAIIAASASTAADGIKTMKDSSSGMITSMGKLALAFAPVAAAIVPFAAAVAAGTVAVVAFAASLVATDAALALMLVEVTAAAAGILAINAAMGAFRMQAMIMGTSTRTASMAFAQFRTAVTPVATALLTIVGPMTAAGAASVALAGGMTGSVAAVTMMAAALAAVTVALGTASAGFGVLSITVRAGMTQANTAVQNGMTQMQTSVNAGMTQILMVTTNGTTMMVAVFRTSGSQIVMIATTTANGVRSAFSIDLSASGRNMMQGLINGMNSMRAQVMSTASSIANAAAQAVNSALQIHSPSKLMIESGQYTGEGLAVGMENRTSDVRTAAQAMTQPVQEEGQQMRNMAAPTDFRSGIIGDTVDSLTGGTNNTTNNTDTSSVQITYSPNYTFTGGTPDEETLVSANKTSQEEFEKMMNEWMRKNKRVSFA